MSNIPSTIAWLLQASVHVKKPEDVNQWYSDAHKFLLASVGEGACDQLRGIFYTAKQFNVCDVDYRKLPGIMDNVRAFLIELSKSYETKPEPVAEVESKPKTRKKGD